MLYSPADAEAGAGPTGAAGAAGVERTERPRGLGGLGGLAEPPGKEEKKVGEAVGKRGGGRH